MIIILRIVIGLILIISVMVTIVSSMIMIIVVMIPTTADCYFVFRISLNPRVEEV